MSDSTATARRSAADRKNSSRPKPDRKLRGRAPHRKNSSRPKPADRKPKTSLFGTDSLQCSALGIHDQLVSWRSTRSTWLPDGQLSSARLCRPCRHCPHQADAGDTKQTARRNRGDEEKALKARRTLFLQTHLLHFAGGA